MNCQTKINENEKKKEMCRPKATASSFEANAMNAERTHHSKAKKKSSSTFHLLLLLSLK